MKKFTTVILALILSMQINVRADEGMWLLSLLQSVNEKEMKAMGLELTAEQIYSLNNASLKDAVGALDGGSCTAELVSPDGLLLTNHHCGYGEIQNHSSMEHNYLKDGFWAMTREEELPNEGKSISFLIRMEEVTDKVLDAAPTDMDPRERRMAMRTVMEEIQGEATEGTHYSARVRPMFESNRFFLFVMETYLDVRLVGAPPESIGKFGGDTDNWMWPRHTGDFSMFRVYTGPDGMPAEYSPDNIPLKSKHFLPVSVDGYEKDDFAMILGFPGTTTRYMTSWEVQNLIDVEHPDRIKLRGLKQEIMMADMEADTKVRIQYSDKYFDSSNGWKYSIGQKKGLKDLNVIGLKQEIEKEFTGWVNADEARKEKYGEALKLIEEGVEENLASGHAMNYLFECIYLGVETVQAGMGLMEVAGILSADSMDQESLSYIAEVLKEQSVEFYKDYNAPTDKKVMAAMLKVYMDDIDDAYQPEFLKEIAANDDRDVKKFVDEYFNTSFMVDKAKYHAFLDNPTLEALENEPAYQVIQEFYGMFMALRNGSAGQQKITEGNHDFLAGLIEMYPERNFYPDANSSMRLTYGTVGDYYPKDAVYYSYYTTLKGVMEKEIPGDYEFTVSEKLKEMYNNKDYGRYGENGVLKTCFTTNNDITGGNSGSPVINGKGELIGIAFDGNWESMSGDVAFADELQKCINVDIRYVLFVIDKFAGASHLVDEMTIVDNPPAKKKKSKKKKRG